MCPGLRRIGWQKLGILLSRSYTCIGGMEIHESPGIAEQIPSQEGLWEVSFIDLGKGKFSELALLKL